MIAVLIDSRNLGSSGWINVRSTQKVLIRGMQEGDELDLHWNFPFNSDRMTENGDMDLFDGATMVKAEIVKVSEGSRIYVDLE